MTIEMTDLRDYIDVLLERWKLVLGMPVLAVVAAALGTAVQSPAYEATAVVALAPATLSVPTSSQVPPYYLIVDSPRRLPTAYTPAYYVALLKGAEVASAAAATAAVTISADASDKSLIEITARSGDPREAAQTANRWADAGAARIVQVLVPSGEEARAALAKLEGAEAALARFSQENGLGSYDLVKLRANSSLSSDRQTELARLLRDRDTAESVYKEFAADYERSTILMTTAYKPTVIQAAVPAGPIAPKWVQNLLIGAGLGLLIGILGAFAVQYLSRKY